MAERTVVFHTKKYIPTYACQEVALCLTDDWAALTVSGVAIVFATLDNTGRYLGSGGYPYAPRWENPRGEEEFQYSLTYDDTQITDPVADVITCADILDISSDACLWRKFVESQEA